jgi:protein SCO1/2
MRQFYKQILCFACIALLALSSRAGAQIVQENPAALQGIDIEEHLGEIIPLDLVFANENGDSVKLEEFFRQNKPVLFSLVYYECPMLCTLILNGLTNGVQKMSWLPGEEFQMVSVSIDPRETPKLAAEKKIRYLKGLGKEDIPEDGWAFLVGQESQIQQLADALGFQYFYDEKQDQYAHPAAAYLLTESGKISRYLYGIEFKPNDLKLGLLEASEGKIGTTLERLILYCYQYDPDAKSYVVFAQNVMKLGGGLALVILIIFLTTLWMRERLRKA